MTLKESYCLICGRRIVSKYGATARARFTAEVEHGE